MFKLYLNALVCFVPLRYLSCIYTIALGARVSAVEYSHLSELSLRPGMTIAPQVALERLLKGPMGRPIDRLVRII